MSDVILLVIWLSLPADTQPAFQVVGVAETMKQCTAVRAKIVKVDKESGKRLACMQILTPLVDASGTI